MLKFVNEKDMRKKSSLNLKIVNILKNTGNLIEKVIPAQSSLYRMIALFGLSITANSKLKRRKLLYLDVALVDHCNLNCIGCANFSCIADKWFQSLESFEQDIARISELSSRNIESLNLIGGEPLLHPQITDFIRLGKKYFPNGNIRITSNGILFTKMPEDFWVCCKENNVQLTMTKYPIHLDMQVIQSIFSKYDLDMQYWNGNIIKTMWKIPLDIEGQQNPKKSFRLCIHANRCTPLIDGKIYICPPCAYIKYFNKTFDKALEVGNKDYIDIYKVNDIDEIFDFICKPASFCRYCKTAKTQFGIKWTTSKKEISEWV